MYVNLSNKSFQKIPQDANADVQVIDHFSGEVHDGCRGTVNVACCHILCSPSVGSQGEPNHNV